jgi:hypothetical protein
MYTRAKSLSILYIRNIIPDDTGIPLLGYRALSGWGEAVFFLLTWKGNSPNWRMEERPGSYK